MEQDEKHRGETPKQRRPYEPPAVDETAVFETLAVQCAKTVGNTNCQYGIGYTSS